jgi:hypothetical protein
MRRRDFVAMLGATASLAVLRRSLAQPAATRAAVVIGVNKSGDLPTLNAAAAGAQEMARWLREEGFEVKELTDVEGPVTASDVFKAVNAFVKLETLDQLLVYFSGHGYLSGNSEHWLLSEAPDDPNQSISTVESVTLARRTRIPNVIFISDACRSTSASLGVQGMHGSLIFPNAEDAGDGSVEIDQFYAALPGASALELPVNESAQKFEGIYTAAFLTAYQQPDAAMVKTLNGVSFVPNRLMKDYLRREVPKRAEAHNVQLSQQPESRIESGETTYIGRVIATTVAGTPTPPAPAEPPEPVTIADVAIASLESAGVSTGRFRVRPASEVADLARESGFSDVRREVLTSVSTNVRIETWCGFVVYGAQVSGIKTGREEMRAVLLDKGGDDRPAIIQLQPGVGSVAIRFRDGSGTVAVALHGHVGTLTVRDGGVANLTYLSRDVDSGTMERLNEMRASVAAAAQYGVFRFDGDRATRTRWAEQMADRIRVLKGIDPSLGLYAAYAYFDADLMDKVRSVADIMRGDLSVDLFDAAMLSGRLSRGVAGRVEPMFPLLTQGWGLLRVTGVTVPSGLLAARDHLKPSLWTTFDAEGMTIAEKYLRGY